jgi:hypothetical protein
MKRQHTFLAVLTAVLALSIGVSVFAQQPAGLFFRETVTVVPSCLPNPAEKGAHPEVLGSYLQADGEIAFTPQCLVSSNLEVTLHGTGKGELKLAHIASPPVYIWSGLVHSGSWAVTFKDKGNYVDLSGPAAKIRWSTREAGFHQLRPVLKLADGTFLVGDYAEGGTGDWKDNEFPIGNVHWRGLDADRMVETPDGKIKDHVDLSKVDEVGFTDLTIGAGHGSGGASRVQWIEVYGKPVKRG